MLLVLLDIPMWCPEEHDHWYDSDHAPEQAPKPDVLSGCR